MDTNLKNDRLNEISFIGNGKISVDELYEIVKNIASDILTGFRLKDKNFSNDREVCFTFLNDDNYVIELEVGDFYIGALSNLRIGTFTIDRMHQLNLDFMLKMAHKFGAEYVSALEYCDLIKHISEEDLRLLNIEAKSNTI